MNSLIKRSTTPFGAIVALFILLFIFALSFIVVRVSATDGKSPDSGRILTIHDGNTQRVIITQANTIGEALSGAGISIESTDAVEPATSEVLVASEYSVNIYRARPVLVIDGPTKSKIITPYQSAKKIAESAGITLYDGDLTTLTKSDDIVSDGAGLILTIKRATPFSFTLYGKTNEVRTQAGTVADMLKEKGLTLESDDKVSPSLGTQMSSGMNVRVWREGSQTMTVDEPIAFDIQKTQDGDRYVGYDEITTAGESGSRSVTYEVTIQDGVEVGRTEIASITIKEPTKQVEVIGVKVILSQGYSAQRVSIMNAAGISSSDQGYAAYIIDHENANWCPTRWQGQNGCPESYVALHPEDYNTGYGMCQATPGNKMASAGTDWKTNPITQMRWCTDYAISRYGSWLSAYNFKVTNGWW
jgi:uncharacterized protein YabE (DUF348 family)